MLQRSVDPLTGLPMFGPPFVVNIKTSSNIKVSASNFTHLKPRRSSISLPEKQVANSSTASMTGSIWNLIHWRGNDSTRFYNGDNMFGLMRNKMVSFVANNKCQHAPLLQDQKAHCTVWVHPPLKNIPGFCVQILPRVTAFCASRFWFWSMFRLPQCEITKLIEIVTNFKLSTEWKLDAPD